LILGVIGKVYLSCINFHIEFDNIHVVYCLPIVQQCMTNIIRNKVHAHKNKSDNNATPVKYVIVNKWVELALARQKILMSHDFSERLEISKVQDAISSEILWETPKKESAKHVSGLLVT